MGFPFPGTEPVVALAERETFFNYRRAGVYSTKTLNGVLSARTEVEQVNMEAVPQIEKSLPQSVPNCKGFFTRL